MCRLNFYRRVGLTFCTERLTIRRLPHKCPVCALESVNQWLIGLRRSYVYKPRQNAKEHSFWTLDPEIWKDWTTWVFLGKHGAPFRPFKWLVSPEPAVRRWAFRVNGRWWNWSQRVKTQVIPCVPIFTFDIRIVGYNAFQCFKVSPFKTEPERCTYPRKVQGLVTHYCTYPKSHDALEEKRAVHRTSSTFKP
jgi:hypothetical protein